MTPAQKEAVRKHRLRQLKKGNSRMEINVPEADKELLELAPLDGVNLDRSRETGRDIEF